jgi:AraC-like DNA-binding protein
VSSSAGWAWSEVDVALPGAAHRLPGVRMAGFSQRAPARWDIAMVPYPAVTLLLDLGEEDGGAIHSTQGRHQRGSVVIGLLPGQVRAVGRMRVDCLQIRLAPAVAAALLGGSTELTGTVVALADIWGRDAEQVEDRLRAAGSWEERFAIAAQVLRRRPAVRRIDPEIAYAWRRTVAGRGRIRVDRLAEEVGWSRQRLWSRFRSQLGTTPKRAARLARFDHAAHLLAAGCVPASVAGDGGYVDQSHLHRETMAIAGLPPSAVATAPWLAIDQVAWPAAPPPGTGRGG